jgi:hypothetical protein
MKKPEFGSRSKIEIIPTDMLNAKVYFNKVWYIDCTKEWHKSRLWIAVTYDGEETDRWMLRGA